jgi:enoyl-CoA hydratase/carnithine racemase
MTRSQEMTVTDHTQLDEVTFAKHGAVGTITLDRPDRLNAISARPGGTRDQVVAALEMAEDDPDIGCVLLRGNGRAFSVGGDLTGNAPRDRSVDDVDFVDSATRFHERITASRVPTIAAVHGFCLGAGVLLAASCDLVIAAERATFGFPEGRLGLAGASALVPTIGRQWAKFLMLTGESLSAAQAREIGLVLAIEPDAELFDRAGDLAARIARMPRDGARLNRRSIDAVADAAGDAAGRAAAVTGDSITLSMAAHATAPDGRTFRSIIEHEGMDGLKRARAAQFDQPWLRTDR